MHGAIVYHFSRFVQEKYGTDSWQRVIEGTPYRDLALVPTATYPDAEFVALIVALARDRGVPAAVLLEQLGEYLAPALLAMYAAFVDPVWRTLDLLMHTEATIHRVVRMRSPGAQPPELECVRRDASCVVITYRSPRRLCAVARGIVRGVAARYGETAEITEPMCMLRGDECCRIDVQIRAAPA